MKTIWELPDKDFYLLCRRIEAQRVLSTRDQTMVTIRMMVKQGLTAAQISNKLRMSKITVRRLIQLERTK